MANMRNGLTYKKSDYKNVYIELHPTRPEKTRYIGQIVIDKKQQKKTGFKTEKEAAKWVDIQLIRAGKEPRNILKQIK